MALRIGEGQIKAVIGCFRCIWYIPGLGEKSGQLLGLGVGWSQQGVSPKGQQDAAVFRNGWMTGNVAKYLVDDMVGDPKQISV